MTDRKELEELAKEREEKTKEQAEQANKLHDRIPKRAEAAGFEAAFVTGKGDPKGPQGWVFRRPADRNFWVTWYPTSRYPITTLLDWLDLFPGA